jgi:thiamine-phosphate pyrophosphorylase
VQWGRIADVNFNRLNESLKLIEDVIRFSLENKQLLQDVRKIRTRFLEVKKRAPITLVISKRSSKYDLGRPAVFDRGGHRSEKDLVVANITRAKEAARILEEILRMEPAKVSHIMKDIRFRLYDLERALFAYYSRAFDPSLYAILDEVFIEPSRLERDIRTMTRNGITVVQLRMNNANDKTVYRFAVKIMRLLSKSSVVFIVNNRIDIALASRAHGVHLGQHDIPVRVARIMLGDHHIIGKTVRTVAQARTAQREGADYIGAGAVFPTRTKEDARVIGIKGLRKICNAVDIPVVGIGGLDNKNYQGVLKAGASGIAVSSYLFQGHLGRNIRSLTGKRR